MSRSIAEGIGTRGPLGEKTGLNTRVKNKTEEVYVSKSRHDGLFKYVASGHKQMLDLCQAHRAFGSQMLCHETFELFGCMALAQQSLIQYQVSDWVGSGYDC